MKLNIKAQTIVELALILPFFFLLFFTLWEFSFFLVKREIATYAAYMSARSYLVYGNAIGENMETKKKEKVYVMTGEDIFLNAFPYFSINNLKIMVDTFAKGKPNFGAEFPKYNELLASYGIAQGDVPNTSDNPSYNTKFGILKFEYEHSWFAGSGNDVPFFVPIPFGKQAVYVPYMIEAGETADFGN